MDECFALVCVMCTMSTPGAHVGQKRALGSPEQELQSVVSHHGCAGNPVQAAGTLNH